MRLQRQGRRGVVLLVCLVMLVLFLLLGITFVLVANQARKREESYANAVENRDDSPATLDNALMDLLRGSPLPTSPLYGVGLLPALYGQDSVRGTLSLNATVTSANQIVAITIIPDPGYGLNPVAGYYNGLVMTVLTGQAAGQSRRIVDYIPSTAAAVGYAGAPAGYTTTAVFHVDTYTPSALPQRGDLVLINGREFSGTGPGYNTATGKTDALDPNGRPYGLLPNVAYFVPNTTSTPTNGLYLAPGGLGGWNVGYTAADYNHPWLSGGEINATSGSQIKPSWHDPALISYWAAKTPGGITALQTSATYVPLMRQISWRPLVYDNPKFTGSNPAYDPIKGPWDVDNRGTGHFDGVWIDIGSPVRKTRDGHTMKALFSFTVRDLDGRLNINTSGWRDQYQNSYTAQVPAPANGAFAGGGATTPSNYPRGQGYGPWEINPLYTLGTLGIPDAEAVTEMKALCEGKLDANGNPIYGRYGYDGGVSPPLPGTPGTEDLLSRVLMTNLYGGSYNLSPTLPGTNIFVTPHDILGKGAVAVDLRGNGYFYNMGAAGDWINSPKEQALSYTLSSSSRDAPFTVGEGEVLLRPNDVDSFSLSNRAVTLAPRLAGLFDEVTTLGWDMPVPGVAAPNYLRSIFVLNNERPKHITDLLRARIIKEHISNDGWSSTTPLTATQAAQVVTEANSLLVPAVQAISPDLLAGLKFNVNRLFGNGLDDNVLGDPGYGTVDDLSEVNHEVVYPAALANALGTAQLQTQFNNIPFDQNSDGVIDSNDKLARYHYAKQLYVLLMLLADQNAFPNLVTETTTLSGAALTNTQKNLLVAKRLAQFAINVVDFRDPDATMTPFEYDNHPFYPDPNNGGKLWTVDGIIDPAGLDAVTTNPANLRRGLVWGCEAPAVLLSECLAFHNIRTDDKANDNGIMTKTTDPTKPDPTLDSIGLPQGTLIAELYSPASPYRWSNAATSVFLGSQDLYTSTGGVNLAKVTSNGTPVWRLAISAPQLGNGVTNPITQPVSTVLGTYPNSTTLEPTRFNDFADGSGNPYTVTIERVVWFCNSDPNTLATNLVLVPGGTLAQNQAEAYKVFYNYNGTAATLVPGGYLVVGPRSTTTLGKLNNGTVDGNGNVVNSPQSINLNPGNPSPVTVTDLNGNSTMPAFGTQIQTPLAMICGAHRPMAPTPGPWTGVNTPQWIGLNISEPLPNGVTNAYYPEPADVANNDSKYATPYDVPLDDPAQTTIPVTPVSALYAKGTNTTVNYRTVFLQRLADPTQPYQPFTNPYITVDFMPLDLTVFNGDNAKFNPAGTIGTVKFRSRERGDNVNFNLWAPAINTTAMDTGAASTPVAGATSFFNYGLIHSLGFLNNSFDASGKPYGQFGQVLTAPAANIGDPTTPFPWLNWFDRPYISQYELLQVPASTPARLCYEFSNYQTTAAANAGNGGNPYTDFYKPNGHLLNFFQTGINQGDGAQLGRVFDYLYVPSKYTETQVVLNPTAFAGPGMGKGRLRPPFNLLSRFREPGKINLNTLYSSNNYNALGNGSPMPAWQNFVFSRRGYGAVTDAQFSIDAASATPTYFGNPFRSPANWDLNPALPATRKEEDVSLLRSDPVTSSNPLFAANTTEAYRNWQRNSYFRYQNINRLGNLTTTRSNVFAVWITVGYFEVEPNPAGVDTAHPDGYRLAGEVGADSGEVHRHRAFYIIDRTIPVGFENGRDYNVKDTILLKTTIE